MPGPNDYHIDKHGELQPGLGKDEPSEAQKAGIRSASAAKLQAIKDELAAAGAQLSEKEKVLIAREEEQIAKERELAKREAALAKAEKKAGVPAGE